MSTFSIGRRLTLVLALAAVFLPGALAAQTAAYIRGAEPPWGQTTNEEAMTDVFGLEGVGWDDLRMADGGGPFSAGYTFIFLEGGDNTAFELATFLDDHRAAIEAFVSGGGFLLLNSAPNEGGDIDFGFGGVTLVYESSASTVTAAMPHPVFVGPFTPVVEDYTGTSFGHATVSGGGLSPIIEVVAGDDVGATVLGEKGFGAGCVVLGGMTTDNFHNPDPESANLRRNIISYTANDCAGIAPFPGAPEIPTLSTVGLALLIATLAAGGLLLVRARS